MFHTACIQRWTTTQSKCPICQQQTTAINGEHVRHISEQEQADNWDEEEARRMQADEEERHTALTEVELPQICGMIAAAVNVVKRIRRHHTLHDREQRRRGEGP